MHRIRGVVKRRLPFRCIGVGHQLGQVKTQVHRSMQMQALTRALACGVRGCTRVRRRADGDITVPIHTPCLLVGVVRNAGVVRGVCERGTCLDSYVGRVWSKHIVSRAAAAVPAMVQERSAGRRGRWVGMRRLQRNLQCTQKYS